MDVEQLARDLVDDLIRSCWVVESARADLYEGWAQHDREYAPEAEMCRERAGLIERSLSERNKGRDVDLVQAHGEWMRSVAGDHPEEVPLAPFFDRAMNASSSSSLTSACSRRSISPRRQPVSSANRTIETSSSGSISFAIEVMREGLPYMGWNSPRAMVFYKRRRNVLCTSQSQA